MVSAEELLRRAQGERAAGRLSAAAQTFRDLAREYPRTDEGRGALLSLGQLELDRGHTRAALRAFDRYLARNGPLAEEARYARIRALRALDRDEAEREATEQFLERHPGSVYAPALRKRLATLR